MLVLLIGGPFDGRRLDIAPSELHNSWGITLHAPIEPRIYGVLETITHTPLQLCRYRPERWRCEDKETTIFVHDDVPIRDIFDHLISGYKEWPGANPNDDRQDLARAEQNALNAGDRRSAVAISRFRDRFDHLFDEVRYRVQQVDELTSANTTLSDVRTWQAQRIGELHARIAELEAALKEARNASED